MLLFGGERKGGPLFWRENISGGNFYQESSKETKIVGERQRESMTIFMRLLKCCLFVSLLVVLQPPVPPSTVIDKAYDRLQAADQCNLLCTPVRTITTVRLPSGLAYLATGFVMLALLGLKGTMQTWLVHKSLGCSQFSFFFFHTNDVTMTSHTQFHLTQL